MDIKFYYIDDDSEGAKSFIKGFSQNGLVIEQIKEKTFDAYIGTIRSKQDIDGVIVDHKLDMIPQNGESHPFRGTSIAQELRNRQLSKDDTYKISDYPIVLLSATENIKNSLDDTGKDLFDLIISKDDLGIKTYPLVISQIKSVSNAYKEIFKNKDIKTLLHVNPKKIDFRFVYDLMSCLREKPIHEVSSFLLHHFILSQGILVDELTLAARLGVNSAISEDWKNLLDILKAYKYDGIYADAWPRWWMFKINEWWNNYSPKSLRSLTASERVQMIKEKFNFSKLQIATKEPLADSDYFWTICKGSNQPIDEIDGLVIAGQSNLYPWEESSFVSINTALNKINVDAWKSVSPIGKLRLSEYSKKK